MYSILYSILYSTQYTVQYTVYCTVYSILYNILYTVKYAVYCTVYSVLYSILYTVQYTVYCILYSIQCTVQYTVYCIVQKSIWYGTVWYAVSARRILHRALGILHLVALESHPLASQGTFINTSQKQFCRISLQYVRKILQTYSRIQNNPLSKQPPVNYSSHLEKGIVYWEWRFKMIIFQTNTSCFYFTILI